MGEGKPIEQNLKALETILRTSFGATAVDRDGPVVVVRHDRLGARHAADVRWKELVAGYNDDGELLLFATLDLRPSEVDGNGLVFALHEANNEGVDYGSFTVSRERDHVRFKVGMSGTTQAKVPAVILADTLTLSLIHI